MIKVLFVCTGNICRSPTAEGVFRYLVEAADMEDRFLIDSAGTESFHTGEKPDPRAREVAATHGVSLENLRARGLAPDDYQRFDYIFAMDGGHMFVLQDRAPEQYKAELRMFLPANSDGSQREVPDPWYGGEQDFKDVFNLIYKGCEDLLQKLKEDHGI